MSLEVQAAVARARHAPLSLEQLTLHEPLDDELIVRIVAVGICHTDIAMRDQLYPVPQPIVLGHEGAGVVERVGRNVSKVVAGDSVVMTFNSCGRCASCFAGLSSYCHDFFGRNFSGARPDGSTALRAGLERVHSHFFGQSSFASHALCRERNVVRVAKTAPLRLLGPLACGIQTGAGAVLNALDVQHGQTLAVFGVGSVGLSAIMAAHLAGATRIVAIDVNASRLALAEDIGATHSIDASEPEFDESLNSVAPQGFDYTIDTTGSPKCIRIAVERLAPRGVCGLLGSSASDATLTLNLAHLMTAGRSVRGIIEGDSVPDIFIPTLVDLFMQNRFPIDRLVTFYPFEEINQAIEDVERGLVIKAIVEMTPASTGSA